jgi:hypothetical protein
VPVALGTFKAARHILGFEDGNLLFSSEKHFHTKVNIRKTHRTLSKGKDSYHKVRIEIFDNRFY